MKKYTLDQIKDEFIGKVGSQERDEYEYELQLDVIGKLIKKARKDRGLTQSQLGELVGVKKAQISKLEKSSNNVTLDTLIKIFNALHAKLFINVQLEEMALSK